MTLLLNPTAILLRNASGFLLQNTTVLLQNVTVVIKRNNFITKCYSYYKLRQYIVSAKSTSSRRLTQSFLVTYSTSIALGELSLIFCS